MGHPLFAGAEAGHGVEVHSVCNINRPETVSGHLVAELFV